MKKTFGGRVIKQILKEVSVYFNPGNMVGIMGPSGSGKTTLLDLLTGRRKKGIIKVHTRALLSTTTPILTQMLLYTHYREPSMSMGLQLMKFVNGILLTLAMSSSWPHLTMRN